MKEELMLLSRQLGFKSKDNLIKVDDSYYYLWMCELQEWLREVHHLHLDAWYNFLTFKWKIDGVINLETNENFDFLDNKEYDIYKTALEHGLQRILKLKITKNQKS